LRIGAAQPGHLVAIAEAEHFGRAAERLRVAQPALTRQIKRLEAELDLQLFERLPRGVRLTPAGRTLLVELRAVHGQIARAVATARAAAVGLHGALRLGFIEAAAWHGLVPDAIRTFRAGFAGVELTLAALPTAQQLAALRQGQMDAALIYNPLPADDLTALPLARHAVVLAVPAGTALAGHTALRLADLTGQPLIGFQRHASPKLHDDLHASFRAVGYTPRYIAELTSETEMLALVSAGAGIAMVNSSQMWRPPHGVRFIPVTDLAVSLQLALVRRKGDLSPVLDHFVRILSAQGPDARAAD